MSMIDELAKIPPFTIHIPGKGDIPINRKLIDEITKPVTDDNFVHQANILPKQIATLGAWLAQARLAYDASHADYREWRSFTGMAIRKPPANAAEIKWKKPTDSAIDDTLRTYPDWKKHQGIMRERERAMHTMQSLVDCLSAKREVLRMLQKEYQHDRKVAPKHISVAG